MISEYDKKRDEQHCLSVSETEAFMKITLRDPASAITHFIALCMTLGSIFPLLIKANEYGITYVIAMMIFVLSMLVLYAASATYHAVTLSAPVIKKFKKLDHSAIFIFIAGSYTPVCLLILDSKQGIPMLIAIWSIAIIGIIIKLLWINCPKWFSSIIYIAMGWMCIFCMKPIIHSVTPKAFFWLLLGGIIYTIGGVIYALKLPIFNAKHKNFGTHEIFHIFVMLGSFCHYIFMYAYVL